MAPLEPEEKARLVASISHELASTPYACTDLEPLLSGTTNFTFRGRLIAALPETEEQTVIVKHTTSYVALNKDFAIDISRCLFEVYALEALNGFPAIEPASGDSFSALSPQLYYFCRTAKIQVLQDIRGVLDLRAILDTPGADSKVSQAQVADVGRAAGAWLRRFHTWTAEPAQRPLAQQVAENDGMRELKARVTCDAFIEVLENFPDIYERHAATLGLVRGMARQEFQRSPGQCDQEDGWGVIHGDFWSGNILVPSSILTPCGVEGNDKRVAIIDWESCQFGPRAFDIGGMLGDMCERNHFKGVRAALSAMEGFIAGYGPVSDTLAFRVAMHAGIFLITWYNRRSPGSPLPAPLQVAREAMALGVQLIVRGWKQDREWFKQSIIASLFAN
ncbi:Protein kinase-like domain protein [Cordyceps fumosorosea ARSEF 2679]|uniref:Protein kinase-like domain protein n=1 Tax=Cordyceps fumosorosea (strain ARSEF 2679) TaxID=1081104 RepID=A0A167PNP4_CORFA|nr:Protein kinase-like domain protein [Cordyceps fumosorosea ARSEF 2679]OAA56860.1 Protein kinase-like domain protein [Cordyceps fumosorosea ARSEF 2679]